MERIDKLLSPMCKADLVYLKCSLPDISNKHRKVREIKRVGKICRERMAIEQDSKSDMMFVAPRII